MVPAVLWMAIVLVVDRSRLGLASAVVDVVQQVGLVVVNLLIGWSNDRWLAGAAQPGRYRPGMWIFTALALVAGLAAHSRCGGSRRDPARTAWRRSGPTVADDRERSCGSEDVMELYQLEHFIAVVEEHSFTRAAERVFRTQGAVSVTIRKLEEEAGVPLMVRDPRECTLTEAGHALLEYAQRIVRLRDELQSRMADIRNLVAGCVTIAAHESAAQYLLPAPLTTFYLQHPNIKIKTRLCDGHQIAHLVAERDADLGFGIKPDRIFTACRPRWSTTTRSCSWPLPATR